MSIKLTPAEFAADIQKRIRVMPDIIMKGVNEGAEWGRNLLASRTPLGVTSQMKRSWDTKKPSKKSTNIENSAPYAGVVEEGARPHSVSAEGKASIALWARRKLGATDQEAQQIAEGVAWKLRKQGQKPTYFVRDSLDEIRTFTAQSVIAAIREISNRRMP